MPYQCAIPPVFLISLSPVILIAVVHYFTLFIPQMDHDSLLQSPAPVFRKGFVIPFLSKAFMMPLHNLLSVAGSMHSSPNLKILHVSYFNLTYFHLIPSTQSLFQKTNKKSFYCFPNAYRTHFCFRILAHIVSLVLNVFNHFVILCKFYPTFRTNFSALPQPSLSLLLLCTVNLFFVLCSLH